MDRTPVEAAVPARRVAQSLMSACRSDAMMVIDAVTPTQSEINQLENSTAYKERVRTMVKLPAVGTQHFKRSRRQRAAEAQDFDNAEDAEGGNGVIDADDSGPAGPGMASGSSAAPGGGGPKRVRTLASAADTAGLLGAAEAYASTAVVGSGQDRRATICTVANRNPTHFADNVIVDTITAITNARKEHAHSIPKGRVQRRPQTLPLFTFSHEESLLIEGGLRVRVPGDIDVALPSCMRGWQCEGMGIAGRFDASGRPLGKELMIYMTPDELLQAVSLGILPEDSKTRTCILCQRMFCTMSMTSRKVVSRLKRLKEDNNYPVNIQMMQFRNSSAKGQYRNAQCIKPLPTQDVGLTDIVVMFKPAVLKWVQRDVILKNAVQRRMWFVDQRQMWHDDGKGIPSSLLCAGTLGVSYGLGGGNDMLVGSLVAAEHAAQHRMGGDIARRTSEVKSGSHEQVTKQMYGRSSAKLLNWGSSLRKPKEGELEDFDSDSAPDDSEGVRPSAVPGFERSVVTLSTGAGVQPYIDERVNGRGANLVQGELDTGVVPPATLSVNAAAATRLLSFGHNTGGGVSASGADVRDPQDGVDVFGDAPGAGSLRKSMDF